FAARRLDLDHVGAEIGAQHRSERAGAILLDSQDRDAREGKHGPSPVLRFPSGVAAIAHARYLPDCHRVSASFGWTSWMMLSRRLSRIVMARKTSAAITTAILSQTG